MANANNLRTSSVPTYDTAIVHTGEEITRQKSVLFNINVQRNSISFIFRLPTETLEAIFIHGACGFYSEDGGLPIRTPPSWVNVSYVCRHWRDVSLKCPTLWTYLFDTSPRWTAELLSRSKQAPLKLHVYINYWGDTSPGLRFVEQVMTHVERLQEFRLRLPLMIRKHQIFPALSLHAPRLETLIISAPYVSPGCEWSSEVLFDGDTPALRTLEFSCCPLPWHSLKLNGLTTLNLCRVPHRFQQTEEFLSTLSCMHGLTHLYLDDALDGSASFISSAVFNTFHKIDLPHLSCLLIIAPLSTVVALLSCINISPTAEVRLECQREYNSLDYYTLLSPSLAQRFYMPNDQAFSNPTIRSLAIKVTWGMTTLTFSASERSLDVPNSTLHVEWGCNIPLQIVIHSYSTMSMSDRDRIISNICSSMPLENVQSVHAITPPFSLAFWSKTLAPLQHLRYLKLSQGYMPDLAPVLSRGYAENQGGYDDRIPDRVLAPALEVLELYDISFSDPLDWERDVLPPCADIRSLYDALSSRKESRGQLTLAQCVVGTSDDVVELDMVGRWEDGHFRVVEECRRPYNELELEGSDSDSLFASQ